MTISEEFSFRNTLITLSNHDIFVICPNRLRDHVSIIKKEKSLNFCAEFFADRFFSGISGYNNLLLSVDFYRRFDSYENILIVQTDALVISDQLEKWCDHNYSYIGAPWFKGFTRPARPLSFLGAGNGGFSLRKIHDFVSVLSSNVPPPPVEGDVTLSFLETFRLIRFILHSLKFYSTYPPIRLTINEDIFWGAITPRRYKYFSVPKPEDAVPFAFESAPEYLYELNGGQLPFGCHAWERYNHEFWREKLGRIGIHLP